MKPITSAITFMTDNIMDPVARMGTRPNGDVFYRTRGGILYELDEDQIAVLDRYRYTVRMTPELAGTKEITRPAVTAVSGGEPSEPSSDAGGAKMDDCNHPGRSDETSGHTNAKSEQATTKSTGASAIRQKGESET